MIERTHFRRTCFLGLMGLLVGTAALGAPGHSVPIYKGAIIMDAGSGAVLFEDHADEISPPASMTKLMTFAVLQDRIASGALNLQTRVRVVPADTRAAPSIIGLKKDEVFPMEELVYAMMLPSANDAALAVAREAGGSVPSFVGLMNEKARALGMNRTTFRSPNGLPPANHRVADGDLTTPRDFALLCRYLLQHTDILKYTSVRTRPFGVNYRFPPTPMTNHNHLLGKIEGMDGLKTGFTNGAGFCLSATAKRNGRRIIVVMMDSPDPKSRDLKTSQLIDLGFTVHPLAPMKIGAPATGPVAVPDANPSGSPAIKFAVPGAMP